MAGDELLREIEGGSARISELVGAIKTFTHMDKAASRKVDVHAGLNSTLIMLGHKLKKGDVEVVRDYEKDLPHVCGHASELNQVWTNLLDNAIDAVDGQGRITVRTASEDGRVLVEVSDDGPGIPDDVRERIFEPSIPRRTLAKARGSAWISPTALSSRTTRAISGSLRTRRHPLPGAPAGDEPGDAQTTVDRDLSMEADA